MIKDLVQDKFEQANIAIDDGSPISNRCACGRIISKSFDRLNGVCRVCNPSSPSNKAQPTKHYSSEKTLAEEEYETRYTR